MLLLVNSEDYTFETRPLGVQMFMFWVFTEVFMVGGITFSNMLFLLVRSCRREMILPLIPDYWEYRGIGIKEQQNEAVDYMSSSTILLGVL